MTPKLLYSGFFSLPQFLEIVGRFVSWSDFKELTMNIGEIDHAINELRALRKRGGMYSRGIPKL